MIRWKRVAQVFCTLEFSLFRLHENSLLIENFQKTLGYTTYYIETKLFQYVFNHWATGQILKAIEEFSFICVTMLYFIGLN